MNTLYELQQYINRSRPQTDTERQGRPLKQSSPASSLTSEELQLSELERYLNNLRPLTDAERFMGHANIPGFSYENNSRSLTDAERQALILGASYIPRPSYSDDPRPLTNAERQKQQAGGSTKPGVSFLGALQAALMGRGKK
jgi:hypothetical protein